MLGSIVGCEPQDKPSVTTITARDYTFQTADTLAAGWTTFRLVNQGTQPHMGQLIRLGPGNTLGNFLKTYSEAFRTRGSRYEGVKRLSGPGVAAPQQTSNATLHLEPGNYAWICLFNLPDGIPHVVGHGMARSFVVRAADGSPAPLTAPKADLLIRLVDYAFRLSAPLKAGRQTIRVENTGSDSHELGVVKLAPGKTIEDFKAWMQHPEQGLSEKTMTISGGVTGLAPGAEAYFEADLTRGEYLLLCFVTAPDGRSHVEHGMIQQIHVE
jgi:hypothetical protein